MEIANADIVRMRQFNAEQVPLAPDPEPQPQQQDEPDDFGDGGDQDDVAPAAIAQDNEAAATEQQQDPPSANPAPAQPTYAQDQRLLAARQANWVDPRRSFAAMVQQYQPQQQYLNYLAMNMFRPNVSPAMPMQVANSRKRPATAPPLIVGGHSVCALTGPTIGMMIEAQRSNAGKQKRYRGEDKNPGGRVRRCRKCLNSGDPERVPKAAECPGRHGGSKTGCPWENQAPP